MVEIFRGQARRRWSEADKRRLVAETIGPGGTVHGVARRHGVSPSQLFAWRKLFRAGLERLTSSMTESEKKVFGWAQNYDNFTSDTFASFIADVTPVKEAAAQMNNVMTQYANPLFYGVGDVDAGLDKLKKAADAAGLDVIMTELTKQGDAYLKART